MVMADPWLSENTNIEEISNNFEDSFTTAEKLPDSEDYLKSLGIYRNN